MDGYDWNKIAKAVIAIENGVGKRIDLENNIVVYAVGANVIRIDIKK